MKAHKLFNILMLVFFILVISVPLIAVNKMPGKISATENRVLASFPDFKTTEGKLNTNFIKDFESWFNDNLGFRDKLVQANSKIQYDLFGKLTRTDTFVGKDNWLYLMYPNMVKAYQNLDTPTQENYNQYKKKFNQLNDYLKGNGIPFITMVNPDKETIYPEYVPETILKVRDSSRTDLVVDYLDKNTNVDIFSTKAGLLEAKENSIVYSKNYDLTHWNNNGAFVGYLELMNRIKKYIPDVNILNENDFIVSPYIRKTTGVINAEETDYKWEYKKGYAAKEERGLLDNLNLSRNSNAYRYVNPSNENLPKALIMGDSYIYMFMLPNLAESFSELTFIHWENAEEIKNYINVLDPDIFILEFMEPALHQFTEAISYPEGYFDKYDEYKDLPVKESPPEGLMWLDSVNNNVVVSKDALTIGKMDKTAKLDGWAVDQSAGSVASNVFLKVGDKYYTGSYGAPRTSVSDYFHNPDLTNSGFTFNVNSEELINAGKISFLVISLDKTYQYAPIEYKIIIK
jgi:hypothetical protein